MSSKDHGQSLSPTAQSFILNPDNRLTTVHNCAKPPSNTSSLPESNAEYPNFVRGPVLNPTISQSPPNPNLNSPQTSVSPSNTTNLNPPVFDPLRPPIVKFTQMSAQGNGNYLLSRFRENDIYSKTRLFLVYFHNKSPKMTTMTTIFMVL